MSTADAHENHRPASFRIAKIGFDVHILDCVAVAQLEFISDWRTHRRIGPTSVDVEIVPAIRR